MDDFTLEALRRYVVLQFIESNSMQNPMDEINKNAVETAKALRDIKMFGMKPPQQQQQQNPFNNPPPVNYGNHPQQPHPNPQQASPNVFQQQFEQQQTVYQYQQAITMMNEMQKQFGEVQRQMFDGLQGLYNLMNDLIKELQQREKPPQQTSNGGIRE